MSEYAVKPLWIIAALVLVAGVAVSAAWGARMALGVAAGGTWNLASVWCLTRLLEAWLGAHPSRTRVILWLLVKCPLLYLLAFGALWTRAVSAEGFGIGFTVVLLTVVAGMARNARRLVTAHPHGR